MPKQDGYEAPVWKHVKATHIDRHGVRYQVMFLDEAHLRAWVKEPSARMVKTGCDSCSGPHRRTNRKCSAGTKRRPWVIRAYAGTSPRLRQGLVLFDLRTRELIPGGPWYVTKRHVPDSRRSGVIEATIRRRHSHS